MPETITLLYGQWLMVGGYANRRLWRKTAGTNVDVKATDENIYSPFDHPSTPIKHGGLPSILAV